MIDIVERLRQARTSTPRLCNEAADELEALRAENAQLRELLVTVIDQDSTPLWLVKDIYSLLDAAPAKEHT